MSSLWTLTERLAAPWVDPVSRTWWPSLLLAAAVAAVVHLWRGGGVRSVLSDGLGLGLWRNRSAWVDVQLLLVRLLLRIVGALPQLGGTFALATGLVMTLDRWVGRPDLHVASATAVTLLYSVVLFVVSDASRYVLHRWLHRVPALWSLHQVHHSAEVLTPVTFHRTHPLETLLYEARGVLATGVTAGLFYWVFRDRAVAWSLFGVNALGIVFNLVTGNLRHSHVWLRYPAAVERWLLSPAQHQLHHSADPADHGNYGVWLSVWDRLAGSLVIAGATPPVRFGVDGANHRPDDLIDALVGPLRDLLPRRAARLAPLLLLVAGSRALAQDDEAEDTDAVEVIEITGEERVPRVAGSAHEITEEELERYEYDDIHRVLARVPGLYVRGEDGFGLRPNIGMRGANSDRSAKVTLTEDGVLLGPAPYAAPAAYYFPLTTRMTGVEVFKGPSSIRFGPTTIGGAIDLHTRGLPDHHAAALDVSYGMRNTVKGHGWGGARFSRWGILLEGIHLSSAGFKQLDGQTRDDPHRADTGFDRQDLMLKLGAWSPSGARVRNGMEVKLGYGRERSDETYLGLSLGDFEDSPYRRYAASADSQMRWDRTQAELAWTLDVPGRFALRTVAYHHGMVRAWTKLNRFAGGPDIHDLLLAQDAGQAGVFLDVLRGEADSTTPDQNLMIGTNDRRFQSWGVQSTGRWWAYGGIVTSQTEIGVRLHGDDVRRVHTEDPFAMTSGVLVPVLDGETLTTLDSDTTALAFSAYVREDLAIGPVRLLPGVRTEVIRTSSLTAGVDTLEGGGTGETGAPIPEVTTRTVVLPGFGIFGSATRWLDLFAGVHRGFAPVAPGQPDDVLPESSWAYEAGGRATTRQTRGELVGFLSDYRNISGSCTFSAGCDETQLDRQFNGGKAWVYGVESSVGHTFLLPRDVSLDAELVYTFTGTAFRTDFVSTFPQFGRVRTGDALPYVPTHQGALRLVVEHPWGSVALAGNARSAMRDVAGQGDIPATEKIPWSYTLDLAADVRVTKFLRVYLNVNNLTDRVNLESFRPFGARPGAPIQANVGVKLNTP